MGHPGSLDLLPTQDSSHLGATLVLKLQAILEMQGVRIRTPNILRINPKIMQEHHART